MRMSQPGPPGQANAAPWQRWLLPAAIVGFLVLLTLPRGAAPGTPLTYTQFVADVGAGTVRAVTIGPAGQVTGSLAGGQPFTTTIPVALGGNGLAGDLAAHHVQVTATAAATSSPLLSVLAGLLPLLLIGGLLYFVIRSARRQAGGLGGGLGHLTSLTKAKARVIDAERPVTRFTDVAGYTAVKTEISEVVDYLRDPGRWHRAGARGPRGVLMAGPPGTGKTLLARAVAGEAHVPFFSVSGSGFVEVFAGVGAARVRDLFEQARTRGPAIVFIDEIDALGARRDAGGFGGSDEREQTLNQLLAEMDGFEDSGGVVVLAATNRPDALDPALRRPGRFDREVLVPLPGRAERAAILAAHARGKNLGPDADLDQVAAATPGFSGADLAGLVNEAAVTAVRSGRTTADRRRLRRRPRPGAARHPARQPAGPRRARHRRRPRGRPRPGRHAVPVRRPGQPGHRAGRRAGPRADRDAARRRPPAVRGKVPGRHPRRPPRRPGRRTPGLRRGLHRRRRRPGLRDRPGHPDGPRVRPQPGDRPGQLQQPAGRPPARWPSAVTPSTPSGWSTRKSPPC